MLVGARKPGFCDLHAMRGVLHPTIANGTEFPVAFKTF